MAEGIAPAPAAQPATPPNTPQPSQSEVPSRPKVQRNGSLREAPPDRNQIPDGTAEDRIAKLLNPKIDDDKPRRRDPGREPATDDRAESQDERPARKESPRVAEEREAAEADPKPEVEEAEDDELSLDDTPTPKAKAEAADDALEDFEYTDEASGRKYIVPKALVEGAMRQQQFTKVTEEVASERRYNVTLRQHLETDQAIQAELAPAMTQVQQLDAHINNLRLQKNQPGVSVERYIEIDRQLAGLTDTRNEFASAVSKRSTELSAQKQAVIEALQGAADNLLSKSLPKWNGPVKRAVYQHLTDSGYTPEEVAAMYDPRLIRLAHDAALLRKVQSKRQATVKQVQAAAPVVRPQGRPSNATTENQQVGRLKAQAQRSGKESDAVSAIDRMLKNSRERAARR